MSKNMTPVKTDNHPVAVIIRYKKYLELKRYIREWDERFAVYDEIRSRNRNAVQEEVESDVSAAIRAVRSF